MIHLNPLAVPDGNRWGKLSPQSFLGILQIAQLPQVLVWGCTSRTSSLQIFKLIVSSQVQFILLVRTPSTQKSIAIVSSQFAN